MQTIHTLPDCRILLVTLPEGSTATKKVIWETLEYLNVNDAITGSAICDILLHYPASWHPVNFISKVTEDEAKPFAEDVSYYLWRPSYSDPDSGGCNGGYYLDYSEPWDVEQEPPYCFTAHESLLSLCKSLNHDPETTFLLVEKKN